MIHFRKAGLHLLFASGCSAVALLASSASLALTLDEAAHLSGRTGFGTAPRDVAPLLPLSRQQAVDRIISSLDGGKPATRPPFAALPRRNYEAAIKASSEDIYNEPLNELAQMQDQWFDQILLTDSPFREHLALFWHGLLTSQVRQTCVTAPILDQIDLFRTVGTDNYRTLLIAMLHDPMLLTFLDNHKNSLEHPNENLARELLELFTLGADHYTQGDIHELARVLAGHHVAEDDGWRYHLDKESVDPGDKTLLGRRISGTPEQQIQQSVDAILAQPQAARYLAGRFYREFVSLEPNPAEIDRLAHILRANNYHIRPMLRAMLLSEDFWTPRNRGVLVKSPVELVAGFVRTFGLQAPDNHQYTVYTIAMGQELLEPPTVAGWRGGLDWLNTGSLDLRRRVMSRLWSAWAVAKDEDPDPTRQGLRIRFSSEQRGAPARFRILVNGAPVEEVKARYGVDMSREASSSDNNPIKPAWETVFIPHTQLPDVVHEITVAPGNLGDDAHLFVNWVEIDGRRLSPRDARATQGAPCKIEPLGMLYCNASLTFDSARAADPAAASISDRAAPINLLLEYGTGRLLLASARTRLTGLLSFVDEPDNELAHASTADELKTLLLRTGPLMTDPRARAGETSVDYARRLTLDPAYNLK